MASKIEKVLDIKHDDLLDEFITIIRDEVYVYTYGGCGCTETELEDVDLAAKGIIDWLEQKLQEA